MKKRLSLLLMLLLCLLFAGCGKEGAGTTNAYSVHVPAATPESGIVKIKLENGTLALNPGAGFICLTRDTHASTYAALGMDKESVLASMTESGIYALLFDTAGIVEVHISAFAISHENYDDMTGYPVAKLAADMKSGFVTNGYDVWSCELMERTGHRFVRSLVSQTYADGSLSYYLDYITCQAGQQVVVGIMPYEDGPISDELQQKTDALVDSIRIY